MQAVTKWYVSLRGYLLKGFDSILIVLTLRPDCMRHVLRYYRCLLWQPLIGGGMGTVVVVRLKPASTMPLTSARTLNVAIASHAAATTVVKDGGSNTVKLFNVSGCKQP